MTEYVAVNVVSYPDKMLGVVIHRGPEKECEKALREFSGIAARGSVVHARGMVMPLDEWERIAGADAWRRGR